MPRPLYGAEEIAVTRFDGGLVRDVDPTEIGDTQCSLAENVDFRDYGLSVRRGYASAATVAVSSKVRGLHRYYKTDGTAKFIVQASTALYEDNGSGALSSVVTGLTGGVPYDLIGYREWVYGGSSADALRKRAADGTWSVVAPLTAPSTLTATGYAPTLHNFDSATENTSPDSGWSWTDTGNTSITADTENKREGTGALTFTFNSGSRGDSAQRLLSLGSVTDLSYASRLLCYVQCNKSGATFELGIAPNSPNTTLSANIANGSVTSISVTSNTDYEIGDFIRINSEILKITGKSGSSSLTVARGQNNTTGTSHSSGDTVRQSVDYSLFQSYITADSGSWTTVEIPLDRIPPARRTAVKYLGLRLSSPGRNFDTAPQITLDQLLAVGPLESDSYTYYATYAVTTRPNEVDVVQQESNEATGLLELRQDATPTYGVKLLVTGSPDATVNVLRFWRYRATGPFRRGRLIGTAPTAATAIDDATDISATDTEVVVDSVVGYSPGCVVTIDSEELLVRDVTASTRTLVVSRGWNGTTPASHLDNAAVTCSYFVDLRGDGDIALENPEELANGRITPPQAATYALANGRLYAGHPTIGGSAYPWRVYLSRAFFPEEFREVQTPDNDPASAGWLDLPTKDYIRRLVEFDGTLLIFCDRSIWSLEGSGWDDFTLYKRADVGLDAREAVTINDRLIYFLSHDGVRVLAPNQSLGNLFPCWVVSEPVESLLRAIPATYRSNAALGVDERGRLHLSFTRAGQTVNDASLVFDPQLGGLGRQEYWPTRPGWTYYTSYGWSCYTRLKRGGGDAGQLVAGAAGSTATIYYLQRSSADADLVTDAGSAIAWKWQGRAYDAGPGAVWEWVYVAADWDAAANQSVTATPVLDGAASGTTYTLTLTSATSGFVPTLSRVAPDIRGRYAQLRLSGSQSVALRARSVRVGVLQRG